MFAEQAFAAVLVPPFGLLHPHVQGHVPLMAVGLPAAQVGVGAVSELNVGLQAPFINGTHADPFHVYQPLHVKPHDPPRYDQVVVGIHVDPSQV